MKAEHAEAGLGNLGAFKMRKTLASTMRSYGRSWTMVCPRRSQIARVSS